MTRFYYNVKPYLPLNVRWAIRRQRAAGIRSRNASTWPITESASQPPESWQGWPEGKKFAFVLTHDVENTFGLSQVRKLAELEMTSKFRSSFNFIPRGEYSVSDDLRAWLGDKGFEVGVHDLHHDGMLYQSREAFRSKARHINEHLMQWGACGFRSGFMLRQLDWLHDLNVTYDASTFDTDPFEPQPDGCRTIFPYFIENTGSGDRPGYVELPYTLPQDSTLFLLLRERSPEIWLRKLDWIVSNGGLALINIHPDYMDFTKADYSDFRYPSSLVESLLRYVSERYAGDYWNPLPRELAAWYAEVRNVGRKKAPALDRDVNESPIVNR